jgi:hypothetical protein
MYDLISKYEATTCFVLFGTSEQRFQQKYQNNTDITTSMASARETLKLMI